MHTNFLNHEFLLSVWAHPIPRSQTVSWLSAGATGLGGTGACAGHEDDIYLEGGKQLLGGVCPFSWMSSKWFLDVHWRSLQPILACKGRTFGKRLTKVVVCCSAHTSIRNGFLCGAVWRLSRGPVSGPMDWGRRADLRDSELDISQKVIVIQVIWWFGWLVRLIDFTKQI